MVLAELGSKVAIALRKMTQATIVDETVMNDMLQEICRALMQADVNVKQVKQMRESIKKNVNVEEQQEKNISKFCAQKIESESGTRIQNKQAKRLMVTGQGAETTDVAERRRPRQVHGRRRRGSRRNLS